MTNTSTALQQHDYESKKPAPWRPLVVTVASIAGFSLNSATSGTGLVIASLAVVTFLVGIALPIGTAGRVFPLMVVGLVLAELARGLRRFPELVEFAARADDALMLIAVPVFLGMLTDARVPARVRNGLTVLAIVPVTGAVMAAFGTISPAGATLGLWLSLKPVVALGVGLGAVVGVKDRLIALRWLMGVAAVVVAFGLLEFVAADLVRQITQPTERLTRNGLTVVRSLFPGPQEYGFFMTIIGAFLWLGRQPGAARALLPLAVMLAGLLSLRAKTILEVVVVVIVAATFANRERIAKVVASLMVTAIVALAAAPIVTGLITLQTDTYIRSSVETPREILYNTSLLIAGDQFPIGVGVGGFGSAASIEVRSPVYREYGLDDQYGFAEGGPVYALDTSWPVVLAEGGILGLAVVWIGAYCIFARRVGPFTFERTLRSSVLLVVVIDSLAGARLYDPFAMAMLGWAWSPSEKSLGRAET